MPESKQMPNLSATEAARQFATFIEGIARQHTRVKFRNHFGLGRGIEAKVIQKDAISAERDKVARNLLQEQPEKVEVIRFAGTRHELVAERLEAPDTSTLADLLSEDAEQGLIITGTKAKLFVYSNPAENLIAVTRETFELPKPPPKPQPKKPRRKPTARPEPKISQRPGRHRR